MHATTALIEALIDRPPESRALLSLRGLFQGLQGRIERAWFRAYFGCAHSERLELGLRIWNWQAPQHGDGGLYGVPDGRESLQLGVARRQPQADAADADDDFVQLRLRAVLLRASRVSQRARQRERGVPRSCDPSQDTVARTAQRAGHRDAARTGPAGRAAAPHRSSWRTGAADALLIRDSYRLQKELLKPI